MLDSSHSANSLETEDKQILFSSSLLRIEKLRCQRARRGLSCEECKSEHQIAVPLSGVNVHHLHGATYTTTPSHLTLSNRGDPYRVSHPHGSGETQLTLVLHEATLLELLVEKNPSMTNCDRPFDRHQLPISPKLRLALQILVSAAKRESCCVLEFEEFSLVLLDRMLDGLTTSVADSPNRSRERALVEAARSLVAARHRETLALDDLASTLGVSVFHLCRAYKRVTGTTLWSDIQRLRTRDALNRLEDGEGDLTTLGLELGYSHHSHFTASFRRELGLTPSAARHLLRNGSLSQVRALLEKTN